MSSSTANAGTIDPPPTSIKSEIGMPTLAESPKRNRSGQTTANAKYPLEGNPRNTAVLISLEEFIGRILASRLLEPAELEQFLEHHPPLEEHDPYGLAQGLVAQGKLSEYQVERLFSGQTFGLVLGNYRIVERIGAGGMGVVYKAEHVHMKRAVAIKVLVTEADRTSVFLQRFYSEMQATAVLSHPNIVLAFDAGEMPVPTSENEMLRYLVMEFVAGQNLEQHVLQHGALPVSEACEYIRQAANGLQHAYEHGLVHRDIKPSNLLLTPQSQVKILDFGLARVGRRRHTEAHTMLGSVDYMAPEQARDARSVDVRADIYGLGGTLYWLLSGHKPFPGDRPVIEELLARQKESPIPLHKVRSDIPLELEAVVYQMMALDPSDRYPTPTAVMAALGVFLEPSSGSSPGRQGIGQQGSPSAACRMQKEIEAESQGSQKSHRVMIVSFSSKIRAACRTALESQGLECLEVKNRAEAIAALGQVSCDLLLVDVQLPDDGAFALCHELRAEPPAAHLKLVILTPENPAGWRGEAHRSGADDCVPRGLPADELAARLRTVLRVKEAEERNDQLSSHLRSNNNQLEQTLRLRDADLYQAQDVLIFAMAKMAELRGLETGAHLLRMQGYVRVLAEEAARLPAFAGRIDGTFVRMLERCVLLHDIGKVAIPDHILLKPGKLEPEERSVMESHTVVGADILNAVARQHGASLAFLQMATDIALHHHERFDGTGYPEGLPGESIPLPARLVTIADVYDALRSKLVYKPGLAHVPSKKLILENNAGQFDPALLVAFRHCEANFEQVFAQTKD